MATRATGQLQPTPHPGGGRVGWLAQSSVRGGVSQLLHSSDLDTWTPIDTKPASRGDPNNSGMYELGVVNKTFVGSGWSDGRAYYSFDGTNWVLDEDSNYFVNGTVDSDGNGVETEGNRFRTINGKVYAVGGPWFNADQTQFLGDTVGLVSSDGVTWRPLTPPFTDLESPDAFRWNNMWDIAGSGPHLVAVNRRGYTTSHDGGNTWESHDWPFYVYENIRDPHFADPLTYSPPLQPFFSTINGMNAVDGSGIVLSSSVETVDGRSALVASPDGLISFFNVAYPYQVSWWAPYHTTLDYSPDYLPYFTLPLTGGPITFKLKAWSSIDTELGVMDFAPTVGVAYGETKAVPGPWSIPANTWTDVEFTLDRSWYTGNYSTLLGMYRYTFRMPGGATLFPDGEQIAITDYHVLTPSDPDVAFPVISVTGAGRFVIAPDHRAGAGTAPWKVMISDDHGDSFHSVRTIFDAPWAPSTTTSDGYWPPFDPAVEDPQALAVSFDIYDFVDFNGEIIAAGLAFTDWLVHEGAWNEADDPFTDADKPLIYTSPNGVDWTPRSSPWLASEASIYQFAPTEGAPLVVVYGSSDRDTGACMSSPDGVTWTSHTVCPQFVDAMAYGGGSGSITGSQTSRVVTFD